MDVHDKSSNWGPTAGFVPCDAAFSKKLTGMPNPDIHPHVHGNAYPVHLCLKAGLLERFIAQGKLMESRQPYSTSGMKTVERLPNYMAPTASSMARGVQMARFFTAGGATGAGPKSTLFCLIREGAGWKVYWVHWIGGSNQGRLIPVWVWGYQTGGGLNPVTGDYDIWLVAPHMKDWRQHARVDFVETAHNTTSASRYMWSMVGDLNRACGRTGNPVFNHGAEEQNYGFTQGLDANLVMFTASGGSRMVSMGDMPQILADLHNAGYFVVWNKRYEELDPHVSGKAKLVNKNQRFRQAVNKVRLNDKIDAAQGMESGSQARRGKLWDGLYLASRMGIEQAKIARFNRVLKRIFEEDPPPRPTTLRAEDFPAGYKLPNEQVRQLQLELEKMVVGTTTLKKPNEREDGLGINDRGQFERWLADREEQLEILDAYWA
jgi:hypothetical protein